MEVEECMTFDLLFRDYNSEDTETVLPLVRKCLTLSQNETEIVRALEIALCFSLKNFSPKQLEEKLFRMACPAAKNFVLDKLNYLEKNPEACFEYLAVVLKVIAYFQGSFEYLSDGEKLTFGEVKSLLLATCEILHGCYSHCRISEDVYGPLFNSASECLSNFFKNCCSLQEQLLDFVTEKSECATGDHNELLLLDEVLISLSKSGTVLIHLEVKTMAKVWKTFANLIQRYLSFVKNSHNIGDTIKELSCNIMTNLELALYKNSEDISKVIKLNCFLLKLLIKFCELFKGCLKGCHQSLLNLLLLLCKCSASLMDKSKIRGNLNEDALNQLTIGIDPLTSELMLDDSLIKEFHDLSKVSDKSAEFVILCCFILKKLVGSNRSTRKLWFNERKNILQWIFHSASSGHFMSSSDIRLPNILVKGKQKKYSDLYEYVLVSTSAFLMTATAEEYNLVEKTLIQNVLQRHPIRSLLAIDMWCLLARFADSELCLSQIVALGKLFQEFNAGTSRPEKWYLGSLVRRLFPLLSERHKGTFLKTFQPSLFSELWLGRVMIGLTPDKASDINNSLLTELDHLLDAVAVERATLERVEERAASHENLMYSRLGNRVKKLWKFDSEVLSSTCHSKRYLKNVCLITACIVSEMPPESLFLVLSQIKKLITIGQPTAVNLYFTCILKALTSVRIQPGNHQKKIITSIADIFRFLLSSTKALSKEKAFETFFSFSHVTSHSEIITLSVQQSPSLKLEVANYFKRKPPDLSDFHLDNYIREVCQLRFEHVCEEERSEGAVASKKMRMWPVDAQEVVVRWKEDARKLVECYQALSDLQKREIKNVCSSILSLP